VGFAAIIIALKLVRSLRQLGGVGLALLGLLGSVLPLPGTVELVTILLGARHRDLWWYYGMMATVGTVVGGCIPYLLAWRGGEQLMMRRLSRKQAQTWMERLHRWGFGAILLSRRCPPLHYWWLPGRCAIPLSVL